MYMVQLEKNLKADFNISGTWVLWNKCWPPPAYFAPFPIFFTFQKFFSRCLLKFRETLSARFLRHLVHKQEDSKQYLKKV